MEYATSQMKLNNWREVGFAIERAKAIESGELFLSIQEAYEAEAMNEADQHTNAVTENAGSDWVDDFIEWMDQFGKSNASAQARTAWGALRAQHSEPAAEEMKAARRAFKERDSTTAYQHYEAIKTKYFASPAYRQVRESLKNRR